MSDSNEYADIIRALRVMHGTILAETKEQFRTDMKETMPSKAADAIEALLADMDALREGCEMDFDRLRTEIAAERDRNGIITQAAQEVTNALRAENERLREALRSILSFPAKPLHLTRDYRIRLPEHVLFEAASIFEQSCKEAKRAVLDGVTKKRGAENE